MDVTTPEEHMGDVIGDVNSRRGMVIELAERGNMKVGRNPRRLALTLALKVSLNPDPSPEL